MYQVTTYDTAARLWYFIRRTFQPFRRTTGIIEMEACSSLTSRVLARDLIEHPACLAPLRRNGLQIVFALSRLLSSPPLKNLVYD